MNNKEKLQHMPECSEFIADIRKHFGDPVRIEARERGQHVSWTKPMHVSVFVLGAINRLKDAA